MTINYHIWGNGDVMYAGSANNNFAMAGNRLLGSHITSFTANGSMITGSTITVSVGSGLIKNHIMVFNMFELNNHTLAESIDVFVSLDAGSVTGSETLISTSSYMGTNPGAGPVLTTPCLIFGYYEPTDAEKSSTLKVIFKADSVYSGVRVYHKTMYVFGG